ncbi:ABC transporter permease [Rhodovastum atsumiense]|uniref:ABC transporter permease n=1 Tax=Rhodovastum atsumiense TaxID=504468 RepID=A0A5M6IM07_9PROT|nr:ABC transporter permease [Rhodovastum atsumiense]KAA5609323.1 ABC transporter permease [Rhodovastum atsumiense]CAH2602380.1 ABC transporter permease [Rhodovastum atsumiense]
MLTLLSFPRPVAALALLGGLLAGTPARAQHQVYDPLPPPGSAYLRFVNGLGDAVALRPDFLPAQTLGTAPEQRVSAYQVVEKVAGRTLGLRMQQGGQDSEARLTVAPGSFVTVILEASGEASGRGIDAVPVVDRTEFNQSRARLTFYNATPGCAAATLALDPDGPAVFQDVAPGSARSRSVNPVSARLKAGCDGQAAPAFALEGLEAGGMYSVWLMRPGEAPTAFLTRDATARWRP